MYRQTIARLDLSIEEGTENVPQDGRFYLVERGVVGRSYKHLRDAVTRYEERKSLRLLEAGADDDDPDAFAAVVLVTTDAPSAPAAGADALAPSTPPAPETK